MKRQKVLFNAEEHTYTCDGQKADVSVTGLIDFFMPKFDADEVVRGIITKKRSRNDVLKHDECIEDHAKYKGMNKGQVLTKWDNARSAGTAFHAEIEKFLLLLDRPQDRNEMAAHFECKEKGLFLDFLESFERQGWTIWQCELRLFDKELSVAGTVDAIFKRRKKGKKRDWEEEEEEEEGDEWEYAVVDWKRSGSSLSDFGPRKCYEPIQHLNDCTYTKYCLQGCIYSYLLTKLYGINVSEVYIVKFPPNGRRYYQVPVPPWDVEPMLKHYQAFRELQRLGERWRERGEDPQELFPL